MKVAIAGSGVVSPSGWGVGPFWKAFEAGEPLPAEARSRAGREGSPSQVRAVPKPEVKLPFLRDPRLRRTSPIGRFAAGAALEALGEARAQSVRDGSLRLGVVTTMFCGCVNYSQRFYREVLDDPHTASPIIFPETVFNAPSSHLSAMLGTHSVNYTMIGDSAEFLCGLELAAAWLLNREVDACLVVCAEEFDWLTAEAVELFQPGCVMGEGAAALCLELADEPEVGLLQVAGPELITARQPKHEAARRVHDAVVGGDRLDWLEPQRCHNIFGEGLGAAAGWQCVAAVERARRLARPVVVEVSGVNEHCAAAVFGSPRDAQAG